MHINEIYNQKILISPLNWGMGHVSRCIGLLRELIAQENEIWIACDSQQQTIFESYFPELEYISHQGYPFEFAGNGDFATDLFLNRKKLLPRFALEQKQVKELVDLYQIELVISDQRYGFFSKKVKSIFVTHQLQLPVKWYQFIASWFNKKLMDNFSEIWCMDDENHAMAGKLSKPVKHKSLSFIGWFSRFSHEEPLEQLYEKLFVISGPEPYSEHFFREVLDYCKKSGEKSACIIPISYLIDTEIPENLQVILAENWQKQDALFHQSKTIVSRAGYSTLMDLKALGKKAILIPTKGQAEQLYLSELHGENPDWKFIKSLAALK